MELNGARRASKGEERGHFSTLNVRVSDKSRPQLADHPKCVPEIGSELCDTDSFAVSERRKCLAQSCRTKIECTRKLSDLKYCNFVVTKSRIACHFDISQNRITSQARGHGVKLSFYFDSPQLQRELCPILNRCPIVRVSHSRCSRATSSIPRHFRCELRNLMAPHIPTGNLGYCPAINRKAISAKK